MREGRKSKEGMKVGRAGGREEGEIREERKEESVWRGITLSPSPSPFPFLRVIAIEFIS